MLAYIADPALTDEQWKLRKPILWLHDAPVSFIRLFEHGIDFEDPTDAQYGIAALSLEVATMTLNTSTERLSKLFE